VRRGEGVELDSESLVAMEDVSGFVVTREGCSIDWMNWMIAWIDVFDFQDVPRFSNATKRRGLLCLFSLSHPRKRKVATTTNDQRQQLNKTKVIDRSQRSTSSITMSSDSTQKPSNAPTLKDYPIGRKGKTELRKLLAQTKEPSATISKFRTQNSINHYLAKAFNTTPKEDTSAIASNKKRTTRNEIKEKIDNESKGVMVEPFEPESVLTFCNYLGISRYEMHKTISDSLKVALESEIDKVDVSKNKNALFDLLSNSWHFVSVPELRNVFLTVMKKLGDQTPVQVLVLLAKRGDTDGELKYRDLLNSLSLNMKRLVWEADFDASVRGDGVPVEASVSSSLSSSTTRNVGTLKGSNLFIDVIRSPVEDYLNDESLRKAADLAYTGSFREKKFDTKMRRAVSTKEKIVSSSAGVTGKLSALANTDKASMSTVKDSAETKNVTGLTLSSLKDVTGPRPKLLAAIVNILIAEHGRNVDKESMDGPMKIVDGSSSLHCTLLSDVLLSFGKLPRQYEHVRLLAQTLDECVQKGIISDKAVAQVQVCMRAIFQPDQDKEQSVTVIKKEKQAVLKPKKKEPKNTNSRVVQNEGERQFELKLLRKIIKGAVTEMKVNDPQGLFLNPVTDDIAPGYSRVIKNPMCIRIIEDKGVNLRYATLGQYEIDVQLMFENCCRYNIGLEGKWFRTEAKRQARKWKDEILKQKKNTYKMEMSKRKKQLANAAGNSTPVVDTTRSTMEENKKKELLERQKQLSMFGSRSVGNKRKHDVISKGNSENTSKMKEIAPLPESKAKKRKKDTSFPSMPALASMLLSDPFVVRLLFDKILRALKNDVIMKDKNIPAEHGTIPSVLQLINIANLSRKICAMKGKIFIIPDAGLILKSDTGDDGADANISESFAVLRNQMPKLATLLLSAEIDRRIAAGGDLQILPRLPESTPEEWKLPMSSQRTILDLVEGSLVLLLQPGVSNEAALLCQCPRFFVAINELSHGEMTEERCFFVSLSQALLRHKTKLPHSVRDMVVEAWLSWFKSRSGESCMTRAVHLCFLKLLNEWTSMGNLVLPIDVMISWSEDAVKAAEANAGSSTFVQCWNENGDDFGEIKSQYERMMRGVPEDRTMKWKDAVGITSI